MDVPSPRALSPPAPKEAVDLEALRDESQRQKEPRSQHHCVEEAASCGRKSLI